MERTLILFILVLAFVCCSVISASAQRGDKAVARQIDDLAASVLAKPTAGLSVAVARDGRTIFSRGYGIANVEHSVPVSTDTVFHIASISKNILAAVLLQLVESGKLSLDDEVKKYVPETPTHGIPITVRQLINHTSGIYSFTSLPNADSNERLDLTHQQVLDLIKDMPLDFEPGTAWRYDNSAFYIAGMVVERVTDQNYGEYVRQHVFLPLGMASARMCDAHMIVPHLSAGYESNGKAIVNAPFMSWKLPSAAGAICTTAADLIKWQVALDSGRLLSPGMLRLMRTPTTLRDGTVIDYGFGTRVGSMDGHPVLGHTGNGGGFGSVLLNYPNDHLTVVVLMNTGSSSHAALEIAAKIGRMILKVTPEKQVDLPVPADELNVLPGFYDSDEGPVEVFTDNSKLHFRIPGTEVSGILKRQGRNWYAVNSDTEVHFLVRNGNCVWNSVYLDGLFMDSKRRKP
ncbi:MAG: serine hydrolase domain-containing protein [Pyrinomonadaceae bacterium]